MEGGVAVDFCTERGCCWDLLSGGSVSTGALYRWLVVPPLGGGWAPHPVHGKHGAAAEWNSQGPESSRRTLLPTSLLLGLVT